MLNIKIAALPVLGGLALFALAPASADAASLAPQAGITAAVSGNVHTVGMKHCKVKKTCYWHHHKRICKSKRVCWSH